MSNQTGVAPRATPVHISAPCHLPGITYSVVEAIMILKQSGGVAAWSPTLVGAPAGCLVSESLDERTCLKSILASSMLYIFTGNGKVPMSSPAKVGVTTSRILDSAANRLAAESGEKQRHA